MTGVLRVRVGGSWEDVGGFGTGVHVGADPPTGYEELWYDTDAVSTADVPVPWITPTLISPWVAGSAANIPIQYRKVGDVVELRGMATRGTAGSTNIFNLPIGYRPTHHMIGLPGVSETVTVNYFAIRVDVYTDGNVLPVSAGNGFTALNFQFSLLAP